MTMAERQVTLYVSPLTFCLYAQPMPEAQKQLASKVARHPAPRCSQFEGRSPIGRVKPES
jgi:hypothetical protein